MYEKTNLKSKLFSQTCISYFWCKGKLFPSSHKIRSTNRLNYSANLRRFRNI